MKPFDPFFLLPQEGHVPLARSVDRGDAAASAFSDLLKALRLRLLGKQSGLSMGVGCSGAAVSYWEAGRRLPSPDMLGRIISTLRSHGGEADELEELTRRWLTEMTRRRPSDVRVSLSAV